jgi:hypothetical protein
MRSTLIEVFENGVITAPDEHLPEYVKLFLKVDENSNIRVEYKVKENNIWSGKFFKQPELDPKELKEILEDIPVDTDYLEDVRTTPTFAKNYNQVMRRMLRSAHMRSYADGYTFIGDAIINLVVAIAIFDKFSHKDTDFLTTYANVYKSNKYLAAISIASGWSKYLDTDKLDCKRIAASYRGLIGAMYKSNGITNLPHIMEYLKRNMLPDCKLSYVIREDVFWRDVTMVLTGTTIGVLVGVIGMTLAFF